MLPMSTCLICHKSFQSLISWHHIIAGVTEEPICQTCQHSLQKISSEVCTICGRSFQSIPENHKHGALCYDCVRWQQDNRWKDVLTKNRSVYVYNNFIKDAISLYKFRGDHVVAQAFKKDFQLAFRNYFGASYTIIPIPLSSERLYERGFNQARALAELLNLPITEALSRIHLEKQSKKSRTERIHTENVFKLLAPSAIINKPVLLIDDIYTTGSTLRHAAELILNANAQSVSSFTLAR